MQSLQSFRPLSGATRHGKHLTRFSLNLDAEEERELCWQAGLEYGVVVSGALSLTGIDAYGRQVAATLGVGDTWCLPFRTPHWVRGLQLGCTFIVCCEAGFDQMPAATYGHA